MNTTKSTIVTALVAVLFGVAAYAAYRLCMPAFIVMTAVFAALGFLFAASLFAFWLESEPRREEENFRPALDIRRVEDALHDADFTPAEAPAEEEARAET